MYGCESWTIKKAEHWRIGVFELWCWRRLLRVPWTAGRSNESVLNEISPEYSMEGLMLKLQYFGYLLQRTDSFEKTWCWEGLKVGEEGDHRGWDGWMASLTQWTWVWVSSRSWWCTGKPGMLRFMGSKESDMTKWLNWTELMPLYVRLEWPAWILVSEVFLEPIPHGYWGRTVYDKGLLSKCTKNS